ncbi:MAG TPA: SRPBCC domain-containing protein [Baekduia sp.]|uniref:CoxG family protein n=1 Tax=Baekduia sp. TaxID=2600305 RepID=UPI002B90864B|nr:SRPBCC domain-containing protein [Baekduia sp.]HMJ36561.1 SRPBCC domain-containing protein [Baekduia sp.]
MRQEFAEVVVVGAPVEEAWRVVSDITTVLSWISIVEDVAVQEPGARYSAVLKDRLGPFKLRADLGISVSADEAARRIEARADGEDRQIGSRLAVDVRLVVREEEGGAVIDVSGAYEVTGRPASLGAASIRKKAQRILSEFFTSVGSGLDSPAEWAHR